MSESSTPRDPAADPAPGPGCRDEALFRAVFDAASDAMLLTDDGGRCVDANPAACALLGRLTLSSCAAQTAPRASWSPR
jgi:PAS domain-containing protein